MEKYDVVLLHGGGMESSVLYRKAVKEGLKVKCVFVNYGQRAEQREWNAVWTQIPLDELEPLVVRLAPDYIWDIDNISIIGGRGKVLPDSSYEEKVVTEDNVYIPARNIILTGIGSAVAQRYRIPEVWLGSLFDPDYPDSSPDFFAMMRGAVDLESKEEDGFFVTLREPFVEAKCSKVDVVQEGEVLKTDWNKVWSCFLEGRKPCGTCPSCVARKEAFDKAGVVDPQMRGGFKCG